MAGRFLKDLRKAGIRVKGDERILGDSDFVENVLKSAEEGLEQKYDLKAKGYDFDRVSRGSPQQHFDIISKTLKTCVGQGLKRAFWGSKIHL